MKSLFFLTCIVGIFFLPGCDGSKQTVKSVDLEKLNRQLDETTHNKALLHFIEGTALDAKGLYADAILEYQEALKAEPNAAIHFAISKDYAIRGNFESSTEAVKNAILLDPANIDYRSHLANIYISTSKIDSAVQEFEEIVRIDSSKINNWFILANLYQMTKPNKALEVYERLLDSDSGQMDVLFECAKIYMSAGQYDKAADKFEKMLDNDPGNRLLKKQLSETYIKGGKVDSAESLLKKIIEEDSSDIDSFIALADAYAGQKQINKSIQIYDNLLNRNIKDAEIRLRICIGFFGLTEHDSTTIPKAQNLFINLCRETPNDWRPYWYLGAIALNQHKDSIAGSYFNKVTLLEENNADAWWFLGSSLFTQEKYDSLLKVVSRPQIIFQDDFRFFFLEGLALTRMEKNSDAVEPLKRAYTLNPKDLNTISTLAMTLDGLQRYQESDKLYEDGLKLDSTSSLLLNNYSYSLAERDLQLDRSLEMSKQAVTAEPENAAYLDTYGWILFKLEKYEEAAVYIEKSIVTGKASAVVYEHLGDIYLKLGKKEKALEKWKKASEIDPKNELLKTKIINWKN